MTDLDELERKARAVLALNSTLHIEPTPREREQAAVILALIERVRAAEARKTEETEIAGAIRSLQPGRQLPRVPVWPFDK